MKGLKTFPYQKYAFKKQVGGRYRSIYGDELTKVVNYDDKDTDLFESDVSPETRTLVDLYDEDEPSTGHRIGIIDIEIDIEGGFPNMEVADKAIVSIAVLDCTTNQYHVFVCDESGRVENSNQKDVTVSSFTDEETMLMTFLEKWHEWNFSIVTGWNIDGFDMPYLYTRMKNCINAKTAKCLSPVGLCYVNPHKKLLVVAGISCLDYLTLYKKFSGKNEPSYALGPIGKKVVGMDKIQYKGNLTDLFRTDINKFIEYNLNDVRIVAALDKKLQFIDLARRICHVGHVSYDSFGMSSRYLEGAILMFLKRNGGTIAPNKSLTGREEYEEQLEEGEEGFSGAFVKEPVPGKYDWVFDLDLTSMYPNILISLNISPETKAGKITGVKLTEEGKKLRTKNLTEEYNRIDTDVPLPDFIEAGLCKFDIDLWVRNKYESYKVGGVEYKSQDFSELVKNSNYSLSSNGILYRQDKRGVIPEILSKWFQQRKDMRKVAADCRKSGDMEGYFFNNQRQQVWKILLNSLYGVLGLPVFRCYDVDNAEAVTTTGVSIIQTTAKAINEYYKRALETENGDWVIYTDTDSCFVDSKPIIKKIFPDIDFNDDTKMTDAIMTVTTEVQLFVNQFYNVMAKRFFNLDKHTFDAKQEVISKTSVWLAKKRYAQWIIHKEGSLLKEPELEVKGIDVVRTSFPAEFRKFMEGFLRNLLQGVSQQKLDEDILTFKDSIKNIDVIAIAKNTSVKFVSQDGKHNYNPESRKPFQIIKGTPAQVKACIYYNDLLNKWEMDKSVEPIHHGQKIKWVYLKKNSFGIDVIAMKADGNDPKKMMDFITENIDRTAMFEKELKSKLIDFYNVFRWQFPNSSMKTAENFFEF